MGLKATHESSASSSYYHLIDATMEHKLCRGLGCLAAKGLNRERFAAAMAQEPRVYCLGKCYAGPASSDDVEEPTIEAKCSTSILVEGIRNPQSALQTPTFSSSDFLDELDRSQLRGRGGGGFPAGRKWRAVAEQPCPTKFVVANADEGDHGSFVDRFLLERNPRLILEALAIAGRAVGAQKAIIYLRKEYPAAKAALLQVLSEAPLETELVIGQGSYVCGEETALLNSIEHRRPEVRSRPPYPFEAGLFGCPTLVQNVETLANIPWILRHGGEAYAQLGYGQSRGTKAICLNSLFVKPGLYEIEFGTALRQIVYDIGGGLRTGELKALMIGGPLAGFITPDELDTPFAFETLQAIGASVGHGGIVAFDQSTSMPEVLRQIVEFGAFESCGKCSPCREGSRALLSPTGRKFGEEIVEALLNTSLCGHGSGMAVAIRSALQKFPEEMAQWFD